MEQWEQWEQWLAGNQALLVATVVLSVVTFVGTLVLVPVLLSRMPSDYFVGPHPPALTSRRLPRFVRLGIRILKNVLGVGLVAMGGIMLVLPGQGVLTILLGVAMLDFPGKRRMEKRLARQPRVRRSIDWIRKRSGRPPLRFDEDDAD